jgi:LmbE family N-acetylglucosaminyl deacetylase
VLPTLAWAAAKPPRQPSASELARSIERLGVVGSVLYVAAHPDDENTRLLSYLANQRLVRTAYLSVTRGDGGQNLIGSEQGPLLGLVRTQELLAARRIDGAEQFFTRARDFGYSKTPEETLAIWNRDEVLADVVWVIRSFRPDVIVTRFPAQGGETHGHHTASAILAEEAFHKAADPNFHPEQLQWVHTWRAKRLLWNKGVFGPATGEDLAGFMKLDVGGYNPALGVSYGEMAAQSRSMHKSQGFGAAPSRGPAVEYFKLIAGERPQHGPFDDLTWTWKRIDPSGKVYEAAEQVRHAFRPEAPESALPALARLDQVLAALPDSDWKHKKRAEIGDVAVACAGLYLDATAADPAVAAGTHTKVTAVAVNRSGAPVQLEEVRLPGEAVHVGKSLSRGQPLEVERSVAVPAEAEPSGPYWLDQPPESGIYRVKDTRLIGRPENPPALAASFVVRVGELTLTIERAIAYKWTDPVAGERYRSVEITPPVMVNVESPILMFGDAHAKSFSVVAIAGKNDVAGTIELDTPPGWKVEPAQARFALAKTGAEQELRFRITPPAAGTTATMRAVATLGGQHIDRGLQRIDYGHIPIQTVLPLAEVKLCRFDLHKGGARIGYIPGAGDELPRSLAQVGYEVTTIDNEMLKAGALARFDAILLGVRAFNVNPRLAVYGKQLMDYVEHGGTIVAQYNTNNRLAKLDGDLGPYPLRISQDRVTDERAQVTFDAAGHAALTRPNKITAADFDGWIQERGLYFADQWDAKYETVLSMHDPGEPARKGSLLIAKFGKGRFVYTGLAFFRQLPAGVPGAYRLLANLLAHAQ